MSDGYGRNSSSSLSAAGGHELERMESVHGFERASGGGEPVGRRNSFVDMTRSESMSVADAMSVSENSDLQALMQQTPYSHTRLVFSWGRGDLAALLWPDADDHNSSAEAPISSKRIMQVAGSLYHAVAVTASGEVYACGSNFDGQVLPPSSAHDGQVYEEPPAAGAGGGEGGHPPPAHLVPRPVKLEALMTQQIVSVSCGLSHTCCLTSTGRVVSFGGNDLGQLGHSADGGAGPATPRAMQGMRCAAVSVGCGDYYSLVLGTDGVAYSCGSTEVLGRGEDANMTGILQPVGGMAGSAVAKIFAGPLHAAALTRTSALFLWGRNTHAQCGSAPPEDGPRHLSTPSRVGGLLLADPAADASLGEAHTVVVTRAGAVVAFGRNDRGQLGVGRACLQSAEPLAVPSFGPAAGVSAASVACGANHSLVLTTEGYLWGFGDDANGQITGGDGGGGGGGGGGGAALFAPQALRSLRSAVVQAVSAAGDQSHALGVGRSAALRTHMRAHSVQRGGPLTRAFSIDARMKDVIGVSAPALLAELEGAEGDSPALRHVLRQLEGAYASVTALGGSFVGGNAAKIDVDGAESVLSRCVDLGGEGAAAALARGFGAGLAMLEGEVGAGPRSEAEEPAEPDDALVRAALMLWLLPIHEVRRLPEVASGYPRLLRCVLLLGRANRARLGAMAFECVPPALIRRRLVDPTHRHLAACLRSHAALDPTTVPALCSVLALLHRMSAALGGVLPAEAFYSEELDKVDPGSLLRDLFLAERERGGGGGGGGGARRFFFWDVPCVIPAAAKQKVLVLEARSVQVQTAQRARREFAMSAMMRTPVDASSAPYLVMEVRRETMTKDALAVLARTGDAQLCKELKVRFVGEDGIDQGGVRKEFFQIATRHLFGAEFGMFVHVDGGRAVWFNRACDWEDETYVLIGKLVALAVYNGVILDVKFPSVVYKKILGQPLGLEDLESVDRELLRGLRQLLAFEPAADVEDVFCRSFEASWEFLGTRHTVELVEGGASIPVTGDNREEYARLYSTHVLVDAVSRQFERFRSGFLRVLGASQVLPRLTTRELEWLVVGEPMLDFHELERVTVYDGGYSAEHPYIRRFWVLVHNMDLETQRKFLMFATGSHMAPVGGLANLRFKVQRGGGAEAGILPTSHTCFNTLILPEYDSMDELNKNLNIAINECEGFGLE